MRKILMALALVLLPVLGIASTAPASAAAPSGMTLLDKLAAGQSAIDQVAYKCHYNCYRVCVRRNYNGYCTYYHRKCHRQCHPVYRRHYHRRHYH
jgi:hypothetical protein